MIKSLRLRIQLWHAIILIVVVTVFSFAFHRQLHHATMGEIDADLLNGARVLEGSLRMLSTLEAATSLEDTPLSLPQRMQFRGGPPRPGNDDLRPPPGPPPHHPDSKPYFAIFNEQGELMRAPDADVNVPWMVPRAPIEYRNVDGRREVLLRGPGSTLIVVGQDVRRQMDRLQLAIVQLVLLAAIVLALGLVGGWWLAGRAIDPINRISQTATKISVANLSQRIETSQMDDEIRSLATVLNEMLSRLERSFEQQSQFTADASHELRTPLAVLLSHCELALNRQRTPDEYQQTIATCQKAGHRMQEMVESLLTLACADSGHLTLNKYEIDLHDLAETSRATHSQLAGVHQVVISVVGSEARCMADPRLISQVIANLVINAIHYSHPGGHVTLETAVEDDHAILRVHDTGIGIPVHAIPHLFDRFFRVDEARARPVGGSGLGLAICKSIVDAHGGTISVASQTDKGSEFTVRIPIRQSYEAFSCIK